LDWLTFLLPRLSAHRLLVVITHRTGEEGSEHALARLRPRFEREGVLATLPLRPLSREAYHDLVAARSGLAGAQAGRLAGWLHGETGGKRFFMHEIVHGLIEAGQIVVGA